MTEAIPAYYLPDVEESAVTEWDVRRFGAGDDAVALRFPVLGAADLRAVLARLRTARSEYLSERPVARIAEAIGEAARRLADPDHPRRRLAEAALPAITGYSAPMIRVILDRMTADWKADALLGLLRSEFGDPAVLDGFVHRPGVRGRARAFGPGLAFHIFAGNVPGVAVTSLVRALLVKAASAGKLASGEPLLPVLFAGTLADVDPDLGRCLALTYWPGGTESLETIAFDAADAVLAYGGEATAASVRRRVPGHVRFILHGPRLSCGLVGREALDRSGAAATAADVAYAVAIFDQQGCVSPHLVYVERGGAVDPTEFARLVADALGAIQKELPRGRISTAEAASIQDLRGAAEFRGLAGHDVTIHAGPDTTFTVIYEGDPRFALSCLNRVVWVKPVGDLVEAITHLRPPGRMLQTVGIAGGGRRVETLAAQLAGMGASRVTSLRDMPWPPPTWHHDGVEPLRSLVSWLDLED